MNGNYSSTKGRAAGSKPVINEPLERVPGPSGRKEREHHAHAKKTPAVLRDLRLKEGMLLFKMGRWDESMQELLLVDVPSLRPAEKRELSYYLGLCLTKLGKLNDAQPHLEKVVASGEDLLRSYQCRMTLAYIHVNSGRPKMAEYELNRLLEAGFESAQLFNTMAFAAYGRKHYRHAIEYYEKALKIEADNATALNSMGFILADTGIDPIKGLSLCRRAAEMRPGNAAYLDSLGWAYYKCKEPATARGWLKKALEIAPHEPAIKEHLRAVSGGAL